MKRDQLSEQAIDQIVTAQADDDSAWEKPIHVRRDSLISLSISADLIEVKQILSTQAVS